MPLCIVDHPLLRGMTAGRLDVGEMGTFALVDERRMWMDKERSGRLRNGMMALSFFDDFGVFGQFWIGRFQSFASRLGI